MYNDVMLVVPRSGLRYSEGYTDVSDWGHRDREEGNSGEGGNRDR